MTPLIHATLKSLKIHRFGWNRWRAWLFAIFATAATLALRIALDRPFGGQPTLIIFALPITLSAYLGGLGPGLLATALSLLGASYYLLPPLHSFAVASTVQRWDQLIVALAGVTVSVLNEALHRARLRAVVAFRQHQRVGAELRESEERFHALVDWSPESLAVTRGGEIVFLNPAALAMMGATTEQELVGKSLLDFIHPASRASAMERIRLQSEVGGVLPPEETRLIRLDGTIIDVERRGRSIVYQGEPATFSSIRDITERKRTDAALRASEASLALAQRVGRFGSWELDLSNTSDLNANPLRWSDEMFRLAGYEPGAVAATNELFFSHIPPGEHQPIREAVQAAIHGRESYSIVHQFVRADGEVRLLQEEGKIFFAPGTVRPERIVGTARDITDERRAQDCVRMQASMLDHIGQAVIATDLAGRIIYANRFAENLYGWSSAELLGRNVVETMCPGVSQKKAQEIVESLQRGECWSGEFRVRRRNGTEFAAFVTDAPFCDHEGALLGIIGISEDGTERHLALEYLQRAEAEQRALVQRLEEKKERLLTAQRIGKVGSWETVPATFEMTWSDETYRIFEAIPGTFQPTHERFLEFVHPADRAAVASAFAGALHPPGLGTIDHRIALPGGRIKTVTERWQTEFSDSGEPVCVLGTCHDITERKEAGAERDRLVAILENTPDLVSIAAPSGQLLYLNGAGRSLLGVEPRADITTTVISQFLPHPARHPILLEGIPSAARDGVWRGDTILLDREGREFPVSQVIVAHRTPEGEIDSFSTTMRDITAMKQVERELRHSQRNLLALNTGLEARVAQRTQALAAATEEAVQANHAKSEFLSRMSHELRTPMNAILGFAQVLESDEALGGEQSDSVGEILSAGRHLLALIDEVLDLSTIEAGRLKLSLEPVALPALLEEMAGLFRPLLEASGIRLLVPHEGAAHMLADRQRLKQVLLNLVGNAIKYNRPGGTVTIACAPAGHAGSMTRLAVTDTGPGIGAGDLARLFTPFERLGAEQTLVKGTGLGLLVARRMVEQMGGTLGVESVVGTGSTFWLDLPSADAPAEPGPPHREEAHADAAEIPEDARALLYIEDNPSNFRLLARLLARRPAIRLLSAETGARGLEVACAQRPDLILLDLHLPDCHGEQVLRCLGLEPRTAGIPVVMLTADAMPEVRGRMLAAGARAFLTKPVDMRDLLKVVDDLLAPASGFTRGAIPTLPPGAAGTRRAAGCGS